MLQPSTSEINLDNAEDACKSDYFSDEGEMKSDPLSSDNGSSGKRKPTDIGLDEAKKIKVLEHETTTTDKAAKLPAGNTSSNDFKRASSVTSDNSDEFVDAVDVLEPSTVIDKKPAASADDVDACAVKNPAPDNVRKSALESEGPKVKENKFCSRLPTFADDPLDRFNSSAIRRGFFKETEPVKPVDYNFDVNPSVKNEDKNENKIVKKVKLNRSKFFSTDKPKFSDDSSSDSNPKFNNSTSPVKLDAASSSENKIIQSVQNENKIATLPTDEKTSATKQPSPSVSSSDQIHPNEIKLSPTIQPETAPVENKNSSMDTKSVTVEPPLKSNVEKNTQDVLQEQVEVVSLDVQVSTVNDVVSQLSEITDSNLDDKEADKLIEEVEVTESSINEPVSKFTDIDEKSSDLPAAHNEPISVQRMEPESESIVAELESRSIEPKSQSIISQPQIIEPDSQSIESEPENTEFNLQPTEPEPQLIMPEAPQIETEPDQSIESSSVSAELSSKPIEPLETPAIESSSCEQIEDEIVEQSTDQVEKLNDDLSLLKNVSAQPTFVEARVPETESKPSVLESVTLQESLPEADLIPEVSESDTVAVNELINTKETTLPESKQITEPVSSKIISDPENLPEAETQSQIEPTSESEVQNVDFDITTESEDLGDDKTEPDVSNEESEGEIEEEEEEEIHEEELYLEDRIPPISKPKHSAPPPETVQSPEPVSSPPTQSRIEEVVEMVDDDHENVLQPSNQSAPKSPLVEQSPQPIPSSENTEDMPIEQTVQSTLPLENIENTSIEKSIQHTHLLENIDDISVEKSIQPTPSVENIENISVEKPRQPTPSVENIESISVEKPRQPTPSVENIESISVEKPIQPTPPLENIEKISAEKPEQPSPLSINVEGTNVKTSFEPSSSVENIDATDVEKSSESISSVENIGNILVEQPAQPAPSENIKNIPIERPVQPTPSENIKNIPIERADHRKQSLKDIENIPMDIDEEPEQIAAPEQIPKGLSRLEQALIGKPGIKRLEIQVPLEELPPQFDPDNARASSADGDETKEKIKLHLSLQGDKVSIKKGPTTVVTSTGEVRVKRQYRKRNKDGNLKPDKTYKLRNRSAKSDDGAAPDKGQNNKPVAPAGAEKCIDLTVNLERKNDKIYSAEPILIDSDDSSKSGPTKVQPIKLKISKNSNVTIECTPSPSETEKNREVEDIRKKESIPNLMEQAATAWSGPDLQRVERLLKESNITITPVMSKEAPGTPHSVLKPMSSGVKERPCVAPKFSTPSVTSTVSSLQTATSTITPISRDKFEDSPSKHTPQKSEHQNGEAFDHLRYREGFETPTSIVDKHIDIKSEIRKMLASADKRKIEPRDSTDAESDSTESKPKLKSIPDLVPINLPTPEMLQTLASSLTTSSTSEGESSADKSKAELDPAFLPLLQTFPKKRGRPTKAMVAAREALKQSQEAALENLKQLATQKASEGQPIPMPILDISDPEDLFKPKRGRKSRSEKMEKSSDAEQSASEATVDPEREAEENKRLEEERIKKEEEKERRNEIRRQKARERNDLVKAKRLRQKMKAEERQKRMQEKRRMLQEEKKKLEEEIKNLPKSLPSFDDETRMSTENSQSQTVSFSIGMGDEDSSNATTELSQRVKKSRMEVTDIDSKDLTVDQIAEYQWPIQGGDLYMIQEQVSNYLGVKSFKRKYPDIKRRPVDSEERAYLVDSGLVSETLCDLGLTAVSSAEVLDIMCADFPDKYEELRKYMREKQMKELSFKQKAWASGLGYKFLMADGSKQDLKKRAMESASNWNSALNKSRSDDRRCAIDLQTFIIHYPKTRTRKMTMPTPKMGSYPVSILPGQFCDFYKTYTSTELRYMPINTVMYGPLKPHATAPGDASQTDSDDSSSSDESSTSSEGTQNTEDTIEDTDKDMSVDESSQLDKSLDLNLLKEQMTMELSENTRELIMDETAKILCKICLGNITRNKENVPEVLIYCSQCSSTSHPSCLDLSLDMVPHIKKYSWQCPDCKICARCKENADEDKMLFCDTCDRGYHIYCVGLKKVPSGRWQCQECTTVENNINCINNSTPVREVFKEPVLIDTQDG